ncbi:MAG: TFIIB-type zinc finger domain-containing protein [Alphaproteobacteria bacterium]|nr:TFIIB-type zinc finger domain-containing protein [Alphaproteobacteria bacterium]
MLRCPACGAPDHSPADGKGVHVCEHCGVRYRQTAQGPKAEPAPAAPAAGGVRPAGALVAAVLVLFAGSMIGALYLATSDDPDPPSRAAGLASPSTPPTSVPDAARASSEAPAPRPDPTAELVVHGTESGYKDSFYVLAEVTSTSPYILDKPKLVVVLLDGEGHEVGQATGYADLPVLGPGQTTPASVLVKDPPAHTEFRVELSLSEASWVPELSEGLRVETLPIQEDRSGWFTVGGTVHNDGAAAAHFVEVLAVARAADGRIVGIDQTYAVGKEQLKPGGQARFQFSSMHYDERPDRWDFLVTGKVAD